VKTQYFHTRHPTALGFVLGLMVAGLASAATVPPTQARSRVSKRKIGYSITLGGNTFRIWGGAKTGVMPKGCSVSPNGKYLYVTNFGNRRSKNVDVLDALTLKRIRTLHWRGNAIESISSLDSATLYVTDFYKSKLHKISTRSWQIKKTVRPGSLPKQMTLSPDGKTLYVANWGGRVAKLDAKTLKRLGRVKTGRYPRGLSVTADGKTLYVANTGGRTVTVVDTTTMRVRKQIPTSKYPRHTALTKDGKLLYVSVLRKGRIEVIDTALGKVIHKIFVGSMPRTIALSKDEKFVYVAVYAKHYMAIIDTKTRKVATLDLEIVKASGLAVHPKDKLIYVTGWCDSDVWTIQRIRPGEKPGPLGPKPKRHTHYRRNKVNPYSLGCR
jgi:YVTN family beta-propeller protein